MGRKKEQPTSEIGATIIACLLLISSGPDGKASSPSEDCFDRATRSIYGRRDGEPIWERPARAVGRGEIRRIGQSISRTLGDAVENKRFAEDLVARVKKKIPAGGEYHPKYLKESLLDIIEEAGGTRQYILVPDINSVPEFERARLLALPIIDAAFMGKAHGGFSHFVQYARLASDPEVGIEKLRIYLSSEIGALDWGRRFEGFMTSGAYDPNDFRGPFNIRTRFLEFDPF